MDDGRSWTRHSWRLGSTLSRMIAAGELAETPIVVLIDNVAESFLPAPFDLPSPLGPLLRRRHLEYGGDPLIGERYLRYLGEELKPAHA